MPRGFAFNRIPLWIRRGLSMNDTNVPQNLVAERDNEGMYSPVQPVVDVMQNGVGVGEQINYFSGLLTGPQSIATSQVVPADLDFSYLVIGGGFGVGVTAGVRNLYLVGVPLSGFPGASTVQAIPFARYKTAAAGAEIASWKDVCGTADARIWVPPGFSFGWFAPDLAGGEQVEFDCALLKVPAGFRPY